MNLDYIFDPFTKPHPASLLTRLGRYMYRAEDQQSSGCVVINKKNEVLLIHRGGIYNDWTFPKGKIENHADPRSEALRETYEEVGLRPEIVQKLPSNNYRFFVDEKRLKVVTTVHLYLARHDPKQRVEIQVKNPDKKESSNFIEAKWFKINDAVNLVSHKREKEILTAAQSR